MTAIRPSELAVWSGIVHLPGKRVVVRRLVSAPPTEVFQLWTDAKRMPDWILA